MKKYDLLLRLICILCVTVLVCGVFAGCQKPGNEPQATEEPTGEPTGKPTGDPSEDPSGDPSEDTTEEPTGTQPDGDSSFMGGEDNNKAPWD